MKKLIHAYTVDDNTKITNLYIRYILIYQIAP